MTFDLALSNLLDKKTKTAVSMAGVGISVVLIFMQLGFRGAVANTATAIYDELAFDVVLRSPEYLHFVDARRIRTFWLRELESFPEVESVAPLQIGLGGWRNPSEPSVHGIMLLGYDPDRPAFRPREVNESRDALSVPDHILIDVQTHHAYGPVDGRRFGPQDIGRATTVNDKQVVIAGTFSIGAGLAANGSLITSQEGFARLLPLDVDDSASLGLIRLKPGVDPYAFSRRVNEWLQEQTQGRLETEMLTRSEVMDFEVDRWLYETPIGFIFNLGVGIAFLVGSTIVFSVMSNDVAKRLREFATMKAMGFSNLDLSLIVLRQSVYLGIAAYLPSLLVALAVYSITAYLANIPIEMSVSRAVFVFVLCLAMSSVSGLASLRRLWQADPASLF